MKIFRFFLFTVSICCLLFVPLCVAASGDDPHPELKKIKEEPSPEANPKDKVKAVPVVSARVIASRIPTTKNKIRNAASNVTVKTKEDLNKQKAATEVRSG